MKRKKELTKLISVQFGIMKPPKKMFFFKMKVGSFEKYIESRYE